MPVLLFLSLGSDLTHCLRKTVSELRFLQDPLSGAVIASASRSTLPALVNHHHNTETLTSLSLLGLQGDRLPSGQPTYLDNSK